MHTGRTRSSITLLFDIFESDASLQKVPVTIAIEILMCQTVKLKYRNPVCWKLGEYLVLLVARRRRRWWQWRDVHCC
jgi:hypothetical protein